MLTRVISIISNEIEWYRNTTPHNKKVARNWSILTVLAVSLVALFIFKMERDIETARTNIENMKAECWESGPQKYAIYGETTIIYRECYGDSRKIMEVPTKDFMEDLREASPLAPKPKEKPALAPTEKKPVKKTSRPAPKKVGATPHQQKMIEYAWEVSNHDEKFIAMIEAESRWIPTQWEVINGGKRGNGYGLCQVDNRYWADIQSDPRFQKEWDHQVRVCLDLWRKGVRFYGADRNNEMIARFWWPKRNT